jgi:hypothetical protein
MIGPVLAFETNPFDQAQSDLIHKLTNFRLYISSDKFTEKEVKRQAKDVLFSIEEVQGFYEELMKV